MAHDQVPQLTDRLLNTQFDKIGIVTNATGLRFDTRVLARPHSTKRHGLL